MNGSPQPRGSAPNEAEREMALERLAEDRADPWWSGEGDWRAEQDRYERWLDARFDG